MIRLLGAGALYFTITYAAGFVFGALREIFVVPRLGRLTATLIETPLMLIMTYLAAHWVVGRFEVLPSNGERLMIGAAGFVMLLAAEIVFSGILRGWTLAQWFGHLQTADGAISLGMFVLFAFMPWLVRWA